MDKSLWLPIIIALIVSTVILVVVFRSIISLNSLYSQIVDVPIIVITNVVIGLSPTNLAVLSHISSPSTQYTYSPSPPSAAASLRAIAKRTYQRV
ncbi:hypothetical protein FHR92_004721 [Fontibacillus solani]|uniref:Uncharacterized protein n=1 Tax=Fontibacillus solani TaxID=1572857 RepID=A0A7W3SY01_9BACL|nr:hypothetical protein [Fontibacillus solani]